MTQTSLFSDPPEPAAGLPMLGVPGTAASLNKAQKLFNKLIGKIDLQRRLLREWNDYLPRYRQTVQTEFEPARDRLRDKRIAMVLLLDAAMDHKALGKTHRAKVQDILLDQLAGLLEEGETPELVRLHDKHSDTSFEDSKQEDLDLAHAVAGSLFGVELDDDERAASAEDLAELIAEKLRAKEAQADAAAAARAAGPRATKAAAKALAAADADSRASQGASHAVRDVYRKLVSELHPDREPDAAQRTRKTALMQQVNQAYAAGDLLALLQLQLTIEQIDAAALANLAQDRLAHYNRVLDEQARQLQQELQELTAPFATMVGHRGRGEFTTAQVDRALAEDLAALNGALHALETDLARFQDIQLLKSSLRHYRIESDDEPDAIDAMLMAEMMRRR